MKQTLRFASLLTLLSFPLIAESVPAVPAGTYTKDGWKLVWSEEFNGTGLPDTNLWLFSVGYVRNNEPQYYTDRRLANCEQRDGSLVITARKEAVPNAAYEEGSSDWRKNRKESEYTSAGIETVPSRSLHFGRIEVRAQMPRTPGAWPAIWTMGEGIRKSGEEFWNWPACGEIDIVEIWAARSNIVYTTLHTATEEVRHWKDGVHRSFGSGNITLSDTEAPWSGYHIYTMDWDEHNLYFYYDGRMYNHVNLDEATWPSGENPFCKPQYLMLNLALGGWGNDLSEQTQFPIEMKVDYVRYYQRER